MMSTTSTLLANASSSQLHVLSQVSSALHLRKATDGNGIITVIHVEVKEPIAFLQYCDARGYAVASRTKFTEHYLLGKKVNCEDRSWVKIIHSEDGVLQVSAKCQVPARNHGLHYTEYRKDFPQENLDSLKQAFSSAAADRWCELSIDRLSLKNAHEDYPDIIVDQAENVDLGFRRCVTSLRGVQSLSGNAGLPTIPDDWQSWLSLCPSKIVSFLESSNDNALESIFLVLLDKELATRSTRPDEKTCTFDDIDRHLEILKEAKLAREFGIGFGVSKGSIYDGTPYFEV